MSVLCICEQSRTIGTDVRRRVLSVTAPLTTRAVNVSVTMTTNDADAQVRSAGWLSSQIAY